MDLSGRSVLLIATSNVESPLRPAYADTLSLLQVSAERTGCSDKLLRHFHSEELGTAGESRREASGDWRIEAIAAAVQIHAGTAERSEVSIISGPKVRWPACRSRSCWPPFQQELPSLMR